MLHTKSAKVTKCSQKVRAAPTDNLHYGLESVRVFCCGSASVVRHRNHVSPLIWRRGPPLRDKTGSYFYLDKELQVMRLFLALGRD